MIRLIRVLFNNPPLDWNNFNSIFYIPENNFSTLDAD